MAVVAAVVSAAVAVGVGIYDIVKANQNAQQTQANVGNFNYPGGGTTGGTPSGSTYGRGGGGGGTPSPAGNYDPNASGGGRTSGNTLDQNTQLPSGGAAYDPNASGGGRTSGNTLAQNTQIQAAPSGVSSPATPSTDQPQTSTPSTPVVSATNEADIAKERYWEAETQIGSMRAQLAQTVGSEMGAETIAEGGIKANTAARGLKLEGSPLMQLIAQKQAGANAIQYTQQQGEAAISGAQTGAQASYDTAALAGKEQIQYADQGISNAWLNAFTGVIGTATDIVNTFWKPSAQSSSPNYDYSNTQNYWDY